MFTLQLQANTPSISRWDETPGRTKGGETPGATPGGTPGGATPGATPGHVTPGRATPGHATPGRTPGATPGASTRQWDATPGHVTPGHVTPGHATPGHITPGHATPGRATPGTARKNRWDETPRTERGNSQIMNVLKLHVELFHILKKSSETNNLSNCAIGMYTNVGRGFLFHRGTKHRLKPEHL